MTSIFRFLKPRSAREAEGFYAKALIAQAGLSGTGGDPTKIAALSEIIVSNCVAALMLDKKFGDAYILLADVTSFWGEHMLRLNQVSDATDLLAAASFCLQELSNKRYFARNRELSDGLSERLLITLVRERRRIDGDAITKDPVHSAWRDKILRGETSWFSAAITTMREP